MSTPSSPTPTASVMVTATPTVTVSLSGANPLPFTGEYNEILQLFRRYKDGQLVARNEQYDAFEGYQYIQEEPASTWTLTHNEGSVAIYNVFDENFNLIFPSHVIEPNNCQTIVEFDSPQAGFINIIFLINSGTGLECTGVPSSPTATPTPTVTPTASVSITPTLTVTPTLSPSITVSTSITPSVTPTISTTATPTPTPSVSQAGISTYDQVIEADNPLAYWPLNTGLTDVISGNNLNYVLPNLPRKAFGVEYSGVELIPDSYGNYAFFDSPNQGLSISNQITLSENFSLEAWIDIEAFAAAPPSDGFFTIFGTTVYGLQFDNGGTLYMYGNTTDSISNSFVAETDTIYHVVLTVDADKNVIFYFNGTPYAGTAQLTETYIFESVGTDANSEFFYGVIGNPAIYNYALTQDQINNHYYAGTHGYRYQNQIILPTPSPTPSSVTPTPSPSYVFQANFVAKTTTDRSQLQSGFSVPYNNSQTNPTIYTACQAQDGHIYIGGQLNGFGGGVYTSIFRLNSDGSFDSTFTPIPFTSPSPYIYTIAQAPDGYIYVGGNFQSNDNLNYHTILRLNSDGTLDTTWAGISEIQSNFYLTAVNIIHNNNDGTIFLGGYEYTSEQNQDLIMMDANGNFISLPAFTVNSVTGLVQNSSGQYYMTANVLQGNTNYNFSRLNSDGTQDTTFSPYETSTPIRTLIQTSDGNMYIGSATMTFPGATYHGVARFTSEGVLDTTFSDLGLNGTVYAIYQTSDGYIYVGGGFTGASGYNYILRLNSDGTLDTTFSGYPQLCQNNEIQGFMEAADGSLYIVGGFGP